MSFKIYDADQISLNIVGIPITSGYADGEFLRIEKETDDFTDVVGTDGSVTRSKTKDERATITVVLMQTADSNAVLAALSQADRAASNGAGVGALFARDRQGTSLYEADECWISKSADATFDREATAREWICRVAKLRDFTGGT